VLSVSEWLLVSGRANRDDFGSVAILLAFQMACFATPAKLRALFPSLSSGTEIDHAGRASRRAGSGERVADRARDTCDHPFDRDFALIAQRTSFPKARSFSRRSARLAELKASSA
jgi:hypothetical protein